MFSPGRIWRDSDGRPIQAHGGGILHDRGVYYWFGENKDGDTTLVPETGASRIAAIGVSCYSSTDLYHWRNEGIALPAVPGDPGHDLHPSRVMERPKVLYNARTGSYVMWLHVDTTDYRYARAGVAVSPTPAGPYRYLGSVSPCGADSRDMTLFQDDDGAAYLVFSSEWNRNTTIARLTDDYLGVDDAFIKTQVHPYRNEGRESPALFKDGGIYYLITSGCSGWEPNAAQCHAAASIWGPWERLGDPCLGPDAARTFGAQGTFVLPVAGLPGCYIFMADRWNPADLRDSRYTWLPAEVLDGSVTIRWHDRWDLSVFGSPRRVPSESGAAARIRSDDASDGPREYAHSNRSPASTDTTSAP